ncbi:MAG: hypothetical protein IJU99_10520 [Lachnospiraceae bacterium]|nr:hypothetical protein [Lachnospiraceae bacterium]
MTRIKVYRILLLISVLLCACARETGPDPAVTVTSSEEVSSDTEQTETESSECPYEIPADAIRTSYRTPEGQLLEGWYAYNAGGEIYGWNCEEALREKGLKLDLVPALGTDGHYGFIRPGESPGEDLPNLYEVFNYMMRQGGPQKQNVYLSDGVTVIDSYQSGTDPEAEGINYGFRYETTPEGEPYGTFEMTENVREDGKQLDLILSHPWPGVLGKCGLIRQSELGQTFETREAFEQWLNQQSGERCVKIYDRDDGRTVIDLLQLRPVKEMEQKSSKGEDHPLKYIPITYKSDDAMPAEAEKTGYLSNLDFPAEVEDEASFRRWLDQQSGDLWIPIYDGKSTEIVDVYHVLPDDAVVWREKPEGDSGDEKIGWYAVNEKGEYYGNAPADQYLQKEGIHSDGLDLMAALGDHGIGGYMNPHEDDLANLDEVKDYMARQTEEQYRYLYDCSGETVVDWWYYPGQE